MKKKKLIMVLLTSVLPVGCGQVANDSDKTKNPFGSLMTSDEQAANELYLDDVEDSSVDEEVAVENDGAVDEGVDESVNDDVKDRRLAQMVEMMMNRLDVGCFRRLVFGRVFGRTE